MSTLTSHWVPVQTLRTADQITYSGRDFIVVDVLEQAIGGWVVIAIAVDDTARPPRRVACVYGNPVATALLAHRVVSHGLQ